MSSMQDNELTLLWQQGTSGAPDPEEISRLAGRASMSRFDRAIFWRNFREYAACLVLLFICGWNIVTGEDRGLGLLGIVCVGFIIGYMWWQHRDLVPLDPSADARAYQAAMLARIDKQIRLLGSVRYWYILPLAIWLLWVVLEDMNKRPLAGVVELMMVVGMFAAGAWLNERSRWGVPMLRTVRAKIEALYDE
jgi:hypothetical protein